MNLLKTFLLFAVCFCFATVDMNAQVVKGDNYYLLNNVKMNTADQAELNSILRSLNQSNYNITFATADRTTKTYGRLSMDKIQLVASNDGGTAQAKGGKIFKWIITPIFVLKSLWEWENAVDPGTEERIHALMAKY